MITNNNKNTNDNNRELVDIVKKFIAIIILINTAESGNFGSKEIPGEVMERV